MLIRYNLTISITWSLKYVVCHQNIFNWLEIFKKNAWYPSTKKLKKLMFENTQIRHSDQMSQPAKFMSVIFDLLYRATARSALHAKFTPPKNSHPRHCSKCIYPRCSKCHRLCVQFLINVLQQLKPRTTISWQFTVSETSGAGMSNLFPN